MKCTHVDVIKPICFNRFIEFIIYTCYPSKTITFANEDYIEYKINELPQIDGYLGMTVRSNRKQIAAW